MKAKKIITGIMIIGMTFGITGLSFAGEKANYRNNDKQVEKADNYQNRSINEKAVNHHARPVVKVNKRQDNQADRIYQGIKSGKITISEYKRLMQEQTRIELAEQRALKDGRITKQEQEKLDWMQKKASENIYEANHNKRVARDVRSQRKNH